MVTEPVGSPLFSLVNEDVPPGDGRALPGDSGRRPPRGGCGEFELVVMLMRNQIKIFWFFFCLAGGGGGGCKTCVRMEAVETRSDWLDLAASSSGVPVNVPSQEACL